MHLLIAGCPLQLLVTSWTIALSNDIFHSHQSAGLAADASLALVVQSHRATKSVAWIKRKASLPPEGIELQKKQPCVQVYANCGLELGCGGIKVAAWRYWLQLGCIKVAAGSKLRNARGTSGPHPSPAIQAASDRHRCFAWTSIARQVFPNTQDMEKYWIVLQGSV